MRNALSSLETDDRPSIQDDLPEDVLRQLQVEELWARRIVLADLINQERLELYAARRALLYPDRLKVQEALRMRPQPLSLQGVVPFRSRQASA